MKNNQQKEISQTVDFEDRTDGATHISVAFIRLIKPICSKPKSKENRNSIKKNQYQVCMCVCRRVCNNNLCKFECVEDDDNETIARRKRQYVYVGALYDENKIEIKF